VAKRNTAKPTSSKTTGRKAAPRTAGKKAPRQHAADGVRVRMYRQGLGDCFLLTFPRPKDGPFHLLIDCGLISGVTPRRPTIMQEVAQSIADTTGKHLHAVVATHEHWDHLSGFLQAQAIFDKMQIDEVWLAWTEDPADDLAARLREGHGRALRGLRAVSERLQGMKAAGQASDRIHALAEHLDGLLGFFGASKTQTTRAALDYLAKGHPSKPKVRYHRPNDPPLTLPGVDGVRAFVLGPPHDEKLIKRINPTKTGQEVYELAGLAPDVAFLAPFGFGESDEADQRLQDQCQAFDRLFRYPPDGAPAASPFRGVYGDAAQAWRRIDDDWMQSAEELALNLDSDTNNTSLALAFELQPGGGVMLFPGDAQVGNWLSWEQCSWPTDAKGGQPITSADLLRRTVLYKVGHHASHNATLRAKGLELMESPDLVAMIPVHHDMAVKKRWPGMPFPPLLARLEEKAHGRVVRIDDGVPKQANGTSASEWKAFQGRVQEQELYIDYTLGL
jgi:hypothetical protein